jgi:hypothetical protein
MATKSKKAANNKRSHQRSATIQWLALGLLAFLALIAAFTLSDGGGGGHSGAPAVVQL